MNKKIKLLGGVFVMALSAISCVNDGFGRDSWDTPPLVCHNKFAAPTISLADFVKSAPSNGTKIITEDWIIDGYVISSDEQGSFYKTIVFQDKPENPTVGLQLEVNRGLNYADFPIGTHIRINAKGLVLGEDRGVVKLGSSDPNYAIGRVSETQLRDHISVVCVDGKTDVANIVPLELPSLVETRNAKYVNQLISVSGVQFSDEEILGAEGTKSYINLSPKEDTNRNLVDKNGGRAVLRTPQYASFGAEKLPEGNGKITFVLGKYNTTYQLQIRSPRDIDFSGERIDVAKSKGGSALVYLKAGDMEDFSSYSKNEEVFPKYINDPVIGDRYWRVSEFRTEKNLQFGYGKGAKPFARTLFAIPIDFSNMSGFSFKSKDAYNTNNKVGVLKVYYSTDYKANAVNPTLVEITSAFHISNSAPEKGFAKSFVDSGIWTRPANLSGKGFIIFEYMGGGDLPATTMQIDDIKID